MIQSIVQPITRKITRPMINPSGGSGQKFTPDQQSASLVLDFARDLYGVQPVAEANNP